MAMYADSGDTNDASSSSIKRQKSSDVDPNVSEAKSQAPVVKFKCTICGIEANCHFGNVRVAGRSHSYRFNEEVYHMMDPFRNRAEIDGRRLRNPADGKSKPHQGAKTTNILDFFVLGALCAICGQAVCLDELCSIFYSKTFCVNCTKKEQKRFPKEILELIEQARSTRQKRQAERKETVAPIAEDL